MSPIRVAVLALCTAFLVAPPAQADRPSIEVEDAPWGYRYEYEDRHCYFAYELEYEAGYPEVEEEGRCPPVHALPRFAPPVPIGAAGARRHAPRREGRGSGDFCDRALAGAVAGAVAGGAIGGGVAGRDDRIVGVIVGGLIGGVLGHEIGRRIDESDRRCMARALEYAEPGVEVDWLSPESDLRYDLRDFGPVRDRHGVPCRRFEMRVEGGRWRDAEACRRGDGAWQLVELR